MRIDVLDKATFSRQTNDARRVLPEASASDFDDVSAYLSVSRRVFYRRRKQRKPPVERRVKRANKMRKNERTSTNYAVAPTFFCENFRAQKKRPKPSRLVNLRVKRRFRSLPTAPNSGGHYTRTKLQALPILHLHRSGSVYYRVTKPKIRKLKR